MGISRNVGLALAACLIAGCAPHPSAVRGGADRLTLTAADGGTVTFEELRRGHDATVLVFWSGGCPCVRRYQERVDALLDRYPAGRVRVAGIASNAGESLGDVKKIARERAVRIPIYRDEGGHLAEALGAATTPTIVVLDAAGVVRFTGWLDNERKPGEPGREPWLEHALDALLDGRGGFAARTPIYGCTITRDLFGSTPAPAEHCPYCTATQTP